MTIRTRRILVDLPRAVTLADAADPLPAGQYEITTEEEPLGDVMYPAYRRTSATLYVPPPVGQIGIGRILNLDSRETEMLLQFETSEPK